MQAGPKYAVSIKNLDYAYHLGELVLRDINFTVAQGDFCAILGPNGGGKSTLLKLILGLIRPLNGEVRIFGRPPEEMRAHIGYVPQFSTASPDLPASALEVTMMGAAVKSPTRGAWWSTRSAARKTAAALLEKVGLGEPGAMFKELSGGQRQRVMLARALMSREVGKKSDPYMLLLDEPTSNIDPQGKFCFYEFLDSIKEDMTVIIVSHDVSLASGVFTSVALVNRELDFVSGAPLSRDTLSRFFGQHDSNCPFNFVQDNLVLQNPGEPQHTHAHTHAAHDAAALMGASGGSNAGTRA